MYEELTKLYESDEYPLHMPGHKRVDGFGQIDDAIKVDITEIDGYDDLYNPEGIIKDALDRAKKIYNTKKTYFLVNGSTVGILTSIFAVIPQGGKALIARNCHKSVYHALELRDIYTDYLKLNQENGIYDVVDPKQLEEKLKENQYDAVIITSPTYEGRVSDIKELSNICHGYDVPLIVDEAHGAHFIFSNRFPKSAVEYADVVIQSTHKTLPTLTQTALLHVNFGRVDIKKIDKYLQMFQTSSPSYVLMSSIDSCLTDLSQSGEKAWDYFFENISGFKQKTAELKNLSMVETDDPCKIVISTVGTDINGPKLAKILLDKYHLQIEMASAAYVIAIVTINDTKEGFGRLGKALCEIDKSVNKQTESSIDSVELGYLLDTKVKEYIYIYPPGIPIVTPGETIEKEQLETIAEYIQAGLKVRGL